MCSITIFARTALTGEPKGAPENPLVVGALEGEVDVTEHELQQSHYVIRRQVCPFTECIGY